MLRHLFNWKELFGLEVSIWNSSAAWIWIARCRYSSVHCVNCAYSLPLLLCCQYLWYWKQLRPYSIIGQYRLTFSRWRHRCRWLHGRRHRWLTVFPILWTEVRWGEVSNCRCLQYVTCLWLFVTSLLSVFTHCSWCQVAALMYCVGGATANIPVAAFWEREDRCGFVEVFLVIKRLWCDEHNSKNS